MEGNASNLLVQFWNDLTHKLVSTSGYRDDVLVNPMAINTDYIDSLDCHHESFHSDKVFMGGVAREAKQLVVQEALLIVLSESYILLMVHTHHKHANIGRRGGDDNFWPHPSSGPQPLPKTSLDATACSAPASPHLILVGSCF